MNEPGGRALPGDTPICRCEEVSLDAVLGAIAEGARTPNDVKRRTRAGMGLCQGIYCAAEIAAILAARTGQEPAAIPPFTARPPARALPLRLVAGAAEDH
ncbi:MAG TPA: (2Fe-2S)-binding protein [Thermomicrobiales bacterium]|nr:(2Fe-2S)-binding protein [Thermomicrobiales bacterium]